MEEGAENEWISNIQKQTNRMTKLVNDLVSLSRLNEELPFPEVTEFSLTDAAWEIAASFTSAAKARDLTLDCQIADGLSMKGDQEAIQRLISILLDNAVKYAISGTIHLTVENRHSRRLLTVSNRCFLPENFDTTRLFDRFYRPDASRSTTTGGTGVGLAMAKAIAESHHGNIKADLPDKGIIRFTVCL